MKSITAIKEEFKNLTPEEISAQIVLYQNDERKGVQSFLLSQKKRWKSIIRKQREQRICAGLRKNTVNMSLFVESMKWAGDHQQVRLQPERLFCQKKAESYTLMIQRSFLQKKREELFEVIQKEAVSVGIGMASPERIDEINILQATYEAMRQAVANLSVKPNLLLNDAVTIPGMDMKQVPIIKGDAKSISIGAASIMAKVYRDRMMEEYDHIFPGYDFASNKGYGSKEHIEAIHRQGPCPIHRRSFLKNICGEQI